MPSKALRTSEPRDVGLTPRQEYTRSAMVILMSQHPEATRGWIAERSIEMADVMVERERRPVTPAPEKAFACDLRQYAEDEPEPPPEQG